MYKKHTMLVRTNTVIKITTAVAGFAFNAEITASSSATKTCRVTGCTM